MTAPTPAALDAIAIRRDLLDRARDPGAYVGYKGDRSLGAWMSEALAEPALELATLRAQVETLTVERDNLLAGLNSIVHCKSGVMRPALREAAAEVLGRRAERWSEDQSPFATLAHEANARAIASDTARASAETALAEAREALRPFAKAADAEHMRYVQDDQRLFLETKAEVVISEELRGADFRRARAALEQKPPPAIEDAECTDCGGTGVTFQTERRCACQAPQKDQP